MSLTRRKSREKKTAINYFNKLLFEFIGIESANHTHHNGTVFYEDVVSSEYERLDKKWHIYVDNVRHNSKKTVKYKPDALAKSMNEHMQKHRKHVYVEYVLKLLKEQYSIEEKYTNIIGYYNEKRKPQETARIIAIKNYAMYFIEIPDINYSINIPEMMDEMNRDQFVYFAGLTLKLYAGEITLTDHKTKMALKFLKVKPEKYKKQDDEAQAVIDENIFRITELLDYFFIEEDDKLKVNLAFTRNLIHNLNVNFVLKLKRKLYGPDNALININFREYKDASYYYRKYMERNDEADLNRMIAVLYRPRNLLTGRKIRYKPEKLEKRAARIGRLPLEERFAVYLFFMACEEHLRYGTITVDGVTIELKLLYEETLKEKQKKQKRKYDINTGLSGVALSLAETGIFGPLEHVYEQNLYDVLLLMYKQRVEYLNQLENS